MNFWSRQPVRFFCSPFGLFFLAVLVRMVAAAGLNYYLSQIAGRDFLIAGDAEGYWILAEKLAAGEEYSLYTPPRQVMRMPGFSFVLAISIFLFGHSLFVARYLLAISCALAVFPAYWMGERYHSRQAGITAAAIIAFMPLYVGFSVAILTECLFATAMLWNVWAIARWRESLPENNRRSLWRYTILSGLFAGLAVYLRPSWLLFPAALILIFDFSNRKQILKSGLSWLVMFGVMLLTLLPWGYRNQEVTGHFVLTTLWMGPSLYDGLRPDADGDSDMTFFEQDRVLERMSEYDMNQYYKQKALNFAAENPQRVLELAGLKCLRYWSLWPNADQFRHPVLILAVTPCFLVLLLSGIWGIWEIRGRLWLVILCAVPLVYFNALHVLFVSSVRYRLPAEFSFAVLSGIGLTCWLEHRRPRKIRH